MPLTPPERKAFILDAMANMAGGILANQQAVDSLSRVFHSGAEVETGIIIYRLAVELADRYDIENP